MPGSWLKQHPKVEGFYWVRAQGQLTVKDYVHPVRVYSSKKNSIVDTIFSDGENFSIDSDMFVEWYPEQIAMPAKEFNNEQCAIETN